MRCEKSSNNNNNKNNNQTNKQHEKAEQNRKKKKTKQNRASEACQSLIKKAQTNTNDQREQTGHSGCDLHVRVTQVATSP